MTRGYIKKFLVETVAYVFTDIPLLFGQPQPLLFLKKYYTVAQGKRIRNDNLNMEELKHKVGLRKAERIIFEIASHFN